LYHKISCENHFDAKFRKAEQAILVLLVVSSCSYVFSLEKQPVVVHQVAVSSSFLDQKLCWCHHCLQDHLSWLSFLSLLSFKKKQLKEQE